MSVVSFGLHLVYFLSVFTLCVEHVVDQAFVRYSPYVVQKRLSLVYSPFGLNLASILPSKKKKKDFAVPSNGILYKMYPLNVYRNSLGWRMAKYGVYNRHPFKGIVRLIFNHLMTRPDKALMTSYIFYFLPLCVSAVMTFFFLLFFIFSVTWLYKALFYAGEIVFFQCSLRIHMNYC